LKTTIILLLSFIISNSLAFAEEPSQGWERLADMPEARSEMESAVIDEKIYVMGGLSNTESITNSVFIFDTTDESWSIGTPMTLELHHAGAASYDGKLYVVGGYFEGWTPSNALLIYNLKTDSWSNGAEMPTPRGALTAQFIDGKLYAIGGFNEFTRAENDKVFSTMTDFENLPSKLPQIFKSVKIISREGNSLVTEELVKMAGRDIAQKVKHVIQPTEKTRSLYS